MTTTLTYQEQAINFLNDTNTTFKAEFIKHAKHFVDDKEARDIYLITLTRGAREFSFNFGQSYSNSGKFWKYGNYKNGVSHGIGKDKTRPYPFSDWDVNKNFSIPTAYDVLACLIKYEVGTFENFCSEFGYDVDSRKAEKLYSEVLNEYQKVCMLWNETEMQQLQEIN